MAISFLVATLCLWGDDPWSVTSTVIGDHGSPVLALAVDATGTTWAAVGLDRSCTLWQGFATSNQPARKVGESEPHFTAAFLMQPPTLVEAGADGTVRGWNLANGQRSLLLPGANQRVTALLPTPDAKRLYAAAADGIVRGWQLDANARSLGPLLETPQPLLAAAISPNGKLLACTGRERKVYVVSLVDETIDTVIELPGIGQSLVFVDDKYLAVGLASGLIRLWDINARSVTLDRPTDHAFGVAAMTVLDQPPRLITGDANGKWYAWTPTQLVMSETGSVAGSINAAVTLPGQSAVLVAGAEGKVYRLEWSQGVKAGG